MKSIKFGKDLHEFHEKCVCRICTCTKHKCPHSNIHIPMDQITSYQKEYVKHPLNPWKKPPQEKAPQYTPYQNLNSSYKDHYPGWKPQMREKIVPRVKPQGKDIPFDGTTEYKTHFPPKTVPRDPVKIKDKLYNPDKQPFDGSTTYKADYIKKNPNPHDKKKPNDVPFPDNYKFNGGTTYNGDYLQKPINPVQSYKPVQKIGETGPHDLNSIYRQDYTEKEAPHICPILKMPERPTKIDHPHMHLTYDKHQTTWIAK